MPAGAGRIGFWYLNQSQDIDFLADWMILTYTFTDGRDLDTRTKVTSPSVPGTYVGWGQGTTQSNILTWGGDNTGTGLESVLVDIGAFRTAYPSIEDITIDCRCQWYAVQGSQPVVLAATLYKGGTMQQQGFSWTPVGAESSVSLNSRGKVVTYYSQRGSDIGYHFSDITYNVNTGIGGINTVDVADINETLSYIVDEK
jgi:hypothetical protein